LRCCGRRQTKHASRVLIFIVSLTINPGVIDEFKCLKISEWHPLD
jgi:hypothetical protein